MLNKITFRVKAFAETDIVKVFSLTSVSTLVKMITGFITVKVAAILIGPAGLALLGQLTNFTTAILIFAAGGITSGVTKYVSEHKQDELAIREYLSTAFQVTLFSTCVCSIVLIAWAEQLSYFVLKDVRYAQVFRVFGATLVFYSLFNLFISILNGFKQFKLFVLVNISSSVAGLIFMVGLIYFFNIDGALIGTVTYQSIVVICIVFFFHKIDWLKRSNFFQRSNKAVIKKYSRFILMSLISTASLPVIQFVLRSYILENVSVTEAGIWEGMNRLSAAYLGIVVTSFTVYYLPKLSEIPDLVGLRKEVFAAYKVVAPLMIIGLLVVFLLRDVAITILFSKEFSSMRDLFAWQLLGDFFKIMSWLLSFIMVAKAMTRAFVITEIVFGVFYLVAGLFFIQQFGVKGAIYAYCLNYLVYLITMAIMFRKLLTNNGDVGR